MGRNITSYKYRSFNSNAARTLASILSLSLFPNNTPQYCSCFSIPFQELPNSKITNKSFFSIIKPARNYASFSQNRHLTFSRQRPFSKSSIPVAATIEEDAARPHVNNTNELPNALGEDDNKSHTRNSTDHTGSMHNICIDKVTDLEEEDGAIDILAIRPSEIDFVPKKKSKEVADSLGEARPNQFVKMFRGSAAYIANHRNSVVVYHIPGEFLEYSGFADLMDDIALTWLLGMKIVIVIGCRHQIESRLTATIPSTPNQSAAAFNNRVTNLSTLRIVKEEAGYARFEVERQLARALRVHHVPKTSGGNVISGNFFAAQPFGIVDGIDYQYTGVLRRVEVQKIEQVHEANDIVLLTTLGFSPSGEVFNVNSEALAARVAGGMKANKIIYFAFNQIQIRKKDEQNRLLQNLRLRDAKLLLEHKKIKIDKRGFATFIVDEEGNYPIYPPSVLETLLKLGWSIDALEKGVKRAHIITPENGALLQELYTRDGSGTLISRDLYEGIRRAEVNDVALIYDLIDPLVRNGALIPRPKSVLEKDIKSYFVYTRDDMVVATGQLKRYEGAFAEIGCLVVHKDYRRGGRGDAMLGFLERLCLKSGAYKVFVLSTQTMEWFLERGFVETDISALPPSKQRTYNHERKSKVYMKSINDRNLDEDELMWDR